VPPPQTREHHYTQGCMIFGRGRENRFSSRCNVVQLSRLRPPRRFNADFRRPFRANNFCPQTREIACFSPTNVSRFLGVVPSIAESGLSGP
jgi:hypothetical protein